MKAPKFPIYWVVLLFVAGMVLSIWVKIPQPKFIFFTLIMITAVSLLKRNFRTIIFLVFIPLGFLHHQQFYTISDNHYRNFIADSNTSLLKIKLTRKLKPNDFQYRYYGKVLKVDDHQTSGNILIAFTKDSMLVPPDLDKIILTLKQPQEISQRTNPGGFDYKNYLKKIKIYDELKLSNGDFKTLEVDSKSWLNRLKRLNDKVEKVLDQSELSTASKNTIKALLLGKRATLEQNLVEAYANAGVIHLLAISGLHIGIIMLFLGFLLQPIRRLPRGQLIYISTIILLLWSFAFFTGASASVVRAVTMFTAFAIAIYAKGIHNTFHLLVVSFFILLVLHPPYLHQVGFQMSYLALIGIIKIHPLIQSIWNPKVLIIRRFWEITTVCLGAQIAVAPLSIYYFHHFPGLFLLSNWLIIPLFSFFLIGSVGVLLLTLSSLTIHPILAFYDMIVEWMNQVIFWIAAQEQFLFKHIGFSILTLLALYGLMICIFNTVITKKAQYIFASFIVVLFLQALNYSQQIDLTKTDHLWIFYRNNQTIIANHFQKSLSIYSPKKIDEEEKLISDFRNKYPIEKLNFESFYNTYISKKERLLVLDKNGLYKIPNFSPTQLLLTDDTEVNLDRVLVYHLPKKVIADGSNKPWNIERWEKSCKKMGIPFLNLRKKGAYKISF